MVVASIIPIRPLDIEFERRAVTAYSSCGSPYTRWITLGMPQLGQYQFLLDIVFFLYPDEESAKQGKKAGGTGFFVSIPSSTYPNQFHHTYAVTNWHVAVQGSPVIRVNGRTGPPVIFPFEPHEWTFLPNHHDIAAIPVTLNPSIHKVEAINFDGANSFCLTNDDIQARQISAAEDVFMLGRFIDYDGYEANVPSMRFGNISMMEAHVEQPTGFKGASLVVDMHSRTGFSGSPVFVYRTAGSIFSEAHTLAAGGHLLKLLGILWGQFPESWDIKDKPQKQSAVLDGKSVQGWSGMSLVCPAEAIKAVLNEPKLQASRAAIDKELHTIFGGTPIPMRGQETR